MAMLQNENWKTAKNQFLGGRLACWWQHCSKLSQTLQRSSKRKSYCGECY
jgi:hypothetical protein